MCSVKTVREQTASAIEVRCPWCGLWPCVGSGGASRCGARSDGTFGQRVDVLIHRASWCFSRRVCALTDRRPRWAIKCGIRPAPKGFNTQNNHVYFYKMYM